MLRTFMAEVSAPAIKDFGEAALWLAALAAAIVGLVKLFRGREATRLETPITVAPHKEYTTLERTERLEKVVHSLQEQQRAEMLGLNRKFEAGLNGLRSDIAEEFKEVRDADARRQSDIAALKAETTHITRQVQVLDAKVDHLPERILKLLGGGA